MEAIARNVIIGVSTLAVLFFLGFTLFNSESRLSTPLASPQVQPFVTAMPEGREVLVNLTEQNGSTQSGVAVLREEYGQVIVSILLDNASTTTEQPAHIHMGSCPEPSEIRYPLSNVVNGRSETTIGASLDRLKAEGPMAINIHESADSLPMLVACGDLPQAI